MTTGMEDYQKEKKEKKKTQTNNRVEATWNRGKEINNCSKASVGFLP